MSLQIKHNIESLQKFQEILEENKSIIIIKFGATWCNPCKNLNPYFIDYMNKAPKNIQYYILDVDENEILYSFLKSKKRIQGIPAILAYYKGNQSYIPNDSIRGFDVKELYSFFDRCVKQIQTIDK
jgi:thiol-disulfide isomerase/thioredoxin